MWTQREPSPAVNDSGCPMVSDVTWLSLAKILPKRSRTLWMLLVTGLDPDPSQQPQFHCCGLAPSLSGGISWASEAVAGMQVQPQGSQDRIRVEVKFRTRGLPLLSFSWLKLKVAVLGFVAFTKIYFLSP